MDEDQASVGAQSALTALLPSWKAAVPLPLSRSMPSACGTDCRYSSKGEASTGSSRPLESAALVEKREPGRVLPLARPEGGLWFGRGRPRAFPTDAEAGVPGITGAIGRNSEAWSGVGGVVAGA
jgi:hypothetical protein